MGWYAYALRMGGHNKRGARSTAKRLAMVFRAYSRLAEFIWTYTHVHAVLIVNGEGTMHDFYRAACNTDAV